MITKAVRKILVDAGIADGRIHAGRVLQNKAFPYVRINCRVVPERCHEGIAMLIWSAQIDVYSKSYAEAVTISEQVRTALEGYSGTVLGVAIRDSQFVDMTDGFSDLQDIEEKIIEFELTTNN